jgi:carbamoyl-phosphate synthase large subunit
MTDLDLLALARHRGEFEAAGCTVMIGSEEIVATCMDKARTSALVRRAGLVAIRTCTLAEFRKGPFYPCFIKPVRGSAGIGASVIAAPAQLEMHVGAFGDRMLLQEYVPGQEFTIDVYRSRDGRVRCVVPRQRLVVRSGEVEKGLTVKDKGLMDAAVKLAQNLEGLWGVFCCQCRRLEGPGSPPRFFEVNPRFGGGAPLSIAAGADLALYLLQEVTGKRITARLGRFRDRLLMLRYEQAVFVPAGDPQSLPGYKTPVFR